MDMKSFPILDEKDTIFKSIQSSWFDEDVWRISQEFVIIFFEVFSIVRVSINVDRVDLSTEQRSQKQKNNICYLNQNQEA